MSAPSTDPRDKQIEAMGEEICRLRSALSKIAKRWPCDTKDTMARLAKDTLGENHE